MPKPYHRQGCAWILSSLASLVVLGGGVSAPAMASDLGSALLRGIQARQLTRLSDSEEQALGQQMDRQLKQSGSIRVSPNPTQTNWVNALGQRLVAVSPRPTLPYTFQVVQDPAVNAFATVGGYIYITTGALQLAQTEDQVAAVLAHEIGHIADKHGLQQLKQQLTTQAGAELLGLGDRRLTGLITNVGIYRPKSREHELAADARALEMLYRAGYDPAALSRVLSKFLSQGSVPAFLSTHPDPPDRLARIQNLMSTQYPQSTPNVPVMPLLPKAELGR